jgi:hypothetical protein
MYVENINGEPDTPGYIYDFPFSKMNIYVLDRFGNQLDNNGQDWSFSIKI